MLAPSKIWSVLYEQKIIFDKTCDNLLKQYLVKLSWYFISPRLSQVYIVVCILAPSKNWSILYIDIKRKNRLLKVCYVPTTSATFLAFFSFFLAVAINSTNETNKVGGTCC
jgi:hypothetical protein